MASKASIFVQRHRRSISTVAYLTLISYLLIVLYDPRYLEWVMPFLDVQVDEEGAGAGSSSRQFVDEKTTTTPYPTPAMAKLMKLPFLPRDFACDQMFDDAGHNFSYSETYYDHSDAYKSALVLNNIVKHGTSNEQYWILMELARLPFVRTVCEAGFDAGGNTFNWLVAQEELVVHSFDLTDHNYTTEMADFMAIEFPERFFLYPGDPKVTIPRFVQANMNKTRCDIIFLDTTQGPDIVSAGLKHLKKIANPVENLVVMDSHPKSKTHDHAFEILWKEATRGKELVEHFRCFFKNPMEMGMKESGLVVGSFNAKKIRGERG